MWFVTWPAELPAFPTTATVDGSGGKVSQGHTTRKPDLVVEAVNVLNPRNVTQLDALTSPPDHTCRCRAHRGAEARQSRP